MKRAFKHIFAIVAFSAAALLFGSTALAQSTGEVHFDKTITPKPDDNGVYTISLEAFVTGSVTVTTETKPADIVLVLDYSQSMDNDVNGNTVQTQNQQNRRINLLRSAVKDFVDIIQESNSDMLEDDGGDALGGHRIAFVLFNSRIITGTGRNVFINAEDLTTVASSGSGRNYNPAQVTYSGSNIIGSNTATGTYSGDAMDQAESVLSGVNYSQTPNRTRVVVFFTDGAPGNSPTETNWQNTTDRRNEANQCIHAANSIKGSSDYKATIYSVGMFPAKTNPDATTTFLSYTSSDYDSAPDITSSAPTGGWVQVSNNKSIIVSSAGALSTVFSSIATSSGGDYSASSSSSVLVDVVAASFAIPTDADLGSVKVYKVACTQQSQSSVISWSTTKVPLTTATSSNPNPSADVTLDVDPATGEVSVTGFDYGAEWCGWDASANNNTGAPHGHKLVLEIPITVKEDAVGGPAVDTNGPGSKLIIKDKDGNVISENDFISPTLKIPVQIWIQKNGLRKGDSAVFTLYSAPFAADFDPETATWTSFTKVLISDDDKITLGDGTVVTGKKIVGLDPDFFYKIKEDGWAWTYTYQYGGVLYTVGEEAPENPFVFENEPKELKFDEAKARNVFSERTAVVED